MWPWRSSTATPSAHPNGCSPSVAQGHKAVFYEAYDDRVEAAFVVDTIASLVGARTLAPGDFAVMYRTNAQSRLLEEAFLQAGLPYKLVGAQRFYGRREVKDVIAYLRLVHNPNDEISLTRVINAPPRGIGTKTFLALRTQAQKAGPRAGYLAPRAGTRVICPESWKLSAGEPEAALGNFGACWQTGSRRKKRCLRWP